MMYETTGEGRRERPMHREEAQQPKDEDELGASAIGDSAIVHADPSHSPTR